MTIPSKIKVTFRSYCKAIFHLQWFSKHWWKYLLEEPRDKHYTSSWKRFWCRARGHPSGCWYYNPGGSEPDYRCKDCGDEL